MFELEVCSSFSAAHAILMHGEREPLHGHDWQVEVLVGCDGLDADGLGCDFHALERALAEVVTPFRSRNLNETAPFDRINPTAEHVARHIAQEMARRIERPLTIRRVRVTEAPGCAARYHPVAGEAA